MSKNITTVAVKQKKVNQTATDTILRAAAYCRVSTLQEEQNGSYKTHYVTDDHEGIVSREVWNKAQERLNRPRNKYPHFLDGKVFCGRCGELYKRQRYCTGGVYFGWTCSGMHRRKKTCKNHWGELFVSGVCEVGGSVIKSSI